MFMNGASVAQEIRRSRESALVVGLNYAVTASSSTEDHRHEKSRLPQTGQEEAAAYPAGKTPGQTGQEIRGNSAGQPCPDVSAVLRASARAYQRCGWSSMFSSATTTSLSAS